MKIPLRRLFPATTILCELLSLLALYLSPEVPKHLFLAPFVLGSAALFTKLRDRFLLPLIALVVVAGIVAGIRIDSTTAVMVAMPMLAVHGLTWLATDQKRYRYWRIGLAFLEMILAAILSPEAHMFFLIFLFVIVVSLTLSFGFLEQNFALRDPEGLGRPLRPAYLAAVLFLSFVIFLSSLAIFPILPRKENMDVNSLGTMPGYSEEVSFQTATFYWTGDEYRPVMWVFQPKGKSWEEAIPYGLLRGKSLERFNGRTWPQGIKRGRQVVSQREPAWSLEILREPMPTDVLPAPYGTESIELPNEAAPFRYFTGEWYQPSGRGRRVSYKAGVSQSIAQDDVVEASESELPREGFTRLTALGEELNKNTRTEKERIDKVMQYFLGGNFSARQVPIAVDAEKGTSPIEAFLFETKTGHCELFATSAALLLRAMGLPTRLVVGFRAPVQSTAAVLTIRNGDAHAWVEVRTAAGWVVLDPTPSIPPVSVRFQLARDFYDWVTAYWHRYILGYEFESASAVKWILYAGAFGAFLFAAAVLGKLLRTLVQSSASHPRLRVTKIRRKLQKQIGASDAAFDVALKNLGGGSEWWREYQELRFGPDIPTSLEERALKAKAKNLLRGVRAEPLGKPGRHG